MKLIRVEIEGYRSIRKPLVLDLDRAVTILLAANDHGKSNVLDAMRHLNHDRGFDAETDLNWDLESKRDQYPMVRYSLELSEDERTALIDAVRPKLRHESALRRSAATSELVATADENVGTATKALQDAKSRVAEAEERVVAEGEAVSETAKEQVEVATADAAEKSDALEAAERQRDDALALDALALVEAKLLASGVEPDEGEVAALLAAAQEDRSVALSSSEATKDALSKAEAALADAINQHGEESDETKKARETEASARAASAKANEARTTADSAVQQSEHGAAAFGRWASGDLEIPPDYQLDDPALGLGDVPVPLNLVRQGLDGDLVAEVEGAIPSEAIVEYLRLHGPRVELIVTPERIPDEVRLDALDEPANEFMRGIFRYAELDPSEWPGMFEQNDVSTKRLHDASSALNAALSASWSQGKELEFVLYHHGDVIALRIRDPAVQDRHVPASRRSSGFTHFFGLKTLLHARACASESDSFIWLFDEPGSYLHPEGQHDLLQVMETLGQANQIVYATHSMFLMNKNYPTRHRLLRKDENGTLIDQKPFAGRWRAAIDALGLAFPGTVLFASSVLLVEGDSEPILLNADWQKLIELGMLSVDLNGLSIMGTGDSKNADALIRVFQEAAVQPVIALLFDGDRGGKNRATYLKKLISDGEIPTLELDANTTVEDYVLAPELFKHAAITYMESIAPDDTTRATVAPELTASFEAADFLNGEPVGLAKWAREEGKRVLKLRSAPSSLGVAREYARLLAARQMTADDVDGDCRALRLAAQLIGMLQLPGQTLEPEQILGD